MAINSQIKARSITSKASSACKINMGLVNGENMMRDRSGFQDYSALVEKQSAAGGGDTTTASEEISIPSTSTKTEDEKKKKQQEITIKE